MRTVFPRTTFGPSSLSCTSFENRDRPRLSARPPAFYTMCLMAKYLPWPHPRIASSNGRPLNKCDWGVSSSAESRKASVLAKKLTSRGARPLFIWYPIPSSYVHPMILLLQCGVDAYPGISNCKNLILKTHSSSPG